MRFSLICQAANARWIRRQQNDIYVKQAHIQNYRCRSAYKLIQTLEKHPFIKPGDVVLDLGAAPGSWSQVASHYCRASVQQAKQIQDIVNPWKQSEQQDIRKSKDGLVISVDLLHFEPLPGVVSLYPQDFKAPDTLAKIKDCLQGRYVDVIISDMAHNLTGQTDVDHDRSIELCRSVVESAKKLPLRKGGHVFMKVLQGGEEMKLKQDLQQSFKQVKFIKPLSSRKESKEIFILAMKYSQQG